MGNGGVSKMSNRLGTIIISPEQGEWESTQRHLFQRGKFDVAKVHIPPGFATSPKHVKELILDGAQTVILRTEDCDFGKDRVASELHDRGFVKLIHDFPDVEWWLEIGNEPEYCNPPMDAKDYHDAQVEVYDALAGRQEFSKLYWIASVPIWYDNAKVILESEKLKSRYDAFGVHVYGHFHVDDDSGQTSVHNLAQEQDLPIWITEFGINDPNTAKSVKAERYLSWINQLSNQHLGAIIFTIGINSAWPQYEIDTQMADVLRDRYDCDWFRETGYSVCGRFKQYFYAYGGVRVFGYPLTNELVENGQLVQYFERDVFEYHPENPPDWQVLQRHLGREMLRQRYS